MRTFGAIKVLLLGMMIGCGGGDPETHGHGGAGAGGTNDGHGEGGSDVGEGGTGGGDGGHGEAGSAGHAHAGSGGHGEAGSGGHGEAGTGGHGEAGTDGGEGGSGEVCLPTTKRLHIGPPEVDLLFVIDNVMDRGAYLGHESELSSRIGGLLNTLEFHGVDYRIAVTTTGIEEESDCIEDGAVGNEAGRFFPVDGRRPRIIDRSIRDRTDLLAANLFVGNCHSYEKGLEAARLALTPPLIDHADDPRTSEPMDGNLGFLRDSAHLAIYVLAHGPEESPLSPEEYHQSYLNVKHGVEGAYSFHGVVSATPVSGCVNPYLPDHRYSALIHWTRGISRSFCPPTWDNIATQLGTELAHRAMQRSWLGTSLQPVDVDENGVVDALDMTLSVDGHEVSPFGDDGTPVWKWSVERHRVEFLIADVPGVRQHVELTYGCP